MRVLGIESSCDETAAAVVVVVLTMEEVRLEMIIKEETELPVALA